MTDYRDVFKPFLVTNEPTSNGDYPAYCPVHEDPKSSQKPSARINFDKEMWYCFVCAPGGSSGQSAKLGGRNGLKATYDARVKSGWVPGEVIHMDDYKASRLERTGAKSSEKPKREVPSNELIEQWVQSLLDNDQRMSWLESVRGFTRETINKWEIGWNPVWKRYSIPVRNADGTLFNVRMYRPNATADKIIWYADGKGQSLFGSSLLPAESDEIVLLEGETDCILASQDGFPALAHTAGSSTFMPAWARQFTGKHVYIIYDNDAAGKKGRELAAKRLAPVAAGVYLVDLDAPGADYTDYRIKHGRTLSDVREAMALARLSPRYLASSSKLSDHGSPVNVEESQDASRGRKALELTVSITGKTEPAYSVPKRVDYSCTLDKGPVCKVCPMLVLYDGKYTQEYRADDPLLPKLIEVNDDRLRKLLREDISAKCSDRLEIDAVEEWSVEHIVVTDSIDLQREISGSPMVRDVYNVGTYRSRVNTTAKIVGHQIPDPRNQRGMLLSWMLEPVETAIDKFVMSPELKERLAIFQPDEKQTALDKCYEIAEDAADNVTRIYGRPELHIAYDLVWHSLLAFSLAGEPMDKGWLEMMVVGDSRTGKSKVASRISNHYNSGAVYSCDQASLAGLIGGLSQPTGKSWHVSWGAIPLNDRRLIVLDETQSLLEKGIIEDMSSIRSSGLAQINKIKQAETSARTRLVWIANPPTGAQISSLPNGGMDGVRQIMPKHEDIARLDFAMAVVRDEVESEIINTLSHTQVQHQFTSELCTQLVAWAWSRKADQVVWGDGVESYLMRTAIRVGNRYTSDFPLVQTENIRMKLARLSAALAARTFSTDDTGELVLINRDHVDGAVSFLSMLYDNDFFGYGRASRRTVSDEKIAKTKRAAIKEYLAGKSKNKPDANGKRIAEALSFMRNPFDTRNLAQAASLDPSELMEPMRWLVESKMIRSTGKGLEKTKTLSAILKELI